MSGPFGSSQWMYASGGFYPYQIEQSLRFNDDDSAYLSRTPASAGDRKTWTWSGWVKRGNFPASTTSLFGAGTLSSNYCYLGFQSGNIFQFQNNASSGSQINAKTTAVFRDPSAWYHFVLSVDTTQATNSDGVRFYVNGVPQTLSFDSYIQNTDTLINFTNAHTVGDYIVGGGLHFDGYMAEVNFIDGTALDPTSFGETKSGIWVPKAYSGAYGTNGFYLSFADSAAIGDDLSGNGNDWTANNLVATDVLLDSPTNNFAVFNPLSGLSEMTLSEGNLKANPTLNTGWHSKSETIGVLSGKWYAEFSMPSITAGSQGNPLGFGIVPADNPFTAIGQLVGDSGRGYGFYCSDTNSSSPPLKRVAGTNTSVGTATATSTSDVFMVAFDLNNGNAWFGKNGTWYAGDPAAGTGASITGIVADEYVFAVSIYRDGVFTNNSALIDHGQAGFTYAPPSGFLALCTANLPDPVIDPAQDDVPADYFNTVLWTGDGVTPRSFSGWGFSPDLIWLKGRSVSSNHALIDKVRGTGGSILSSDTTGAENDFGLVVNSFDADGFTGATGSLNFSYANSSSQTYVGWGWLAGNGTASNTDGSITSTVSVNQKAGFSVVSYTGTGATSSSVTIGHGLGETPAMVITKKRAGGTDYGWSTWHKDLGGNYGIWLDKTGARNPSMWDGYTNISSTVFSPPNLLYGNESGADYINYLFAEVEGYSKFGSYTGNGSTDGPFVWCGFRPAWVMVKLTDSTGSWTLLDAERSPYNDVDDFLYANLSNAELANTSADVDFLSNGFKIRNITSDQNTSGGTYIYMAFAELPAKYSLAR